MADFTLDGYRALLEAFMQRGYVAGRFSEDGPLDRHLFLRHDLDMSIQAAVAVAKIEREAGLMTTYFVMVRTEMYNPFSKRGLADIIQLADLGHELGLHFDGSLYGEDLEALDEAAERECAALEVLTNLPVTVISLHRPAPVLQGLDRRIAGRLHTYSPRFFQDMGYCSDSRGDWHHGHPLDHPAVAAGRGFQLLTHPIWWQAAPNEAVREKLDRFALKRFDLLRAELARNCEAYPQEYQTDYIEG